MTETLIRPPEAASAPFEYNIDPNILRRIVVGEADNFDDGESRTINDPENSLYGIVEDVDYTPGDEDNSRRAVFAIVPEVEKYLGSRFKSNNPEASMQRAFAKAQREIEKSNKSGILSRDPASAAAGVIKFYQTEAGSPEGVYGVSGDVRIYEASTNGVRLLAHGERDSQTGEVSHYFSHDRSTFKPQIGRVTPAPGSRYVITSDSLMEDSKKQYILPEHLSVALQMQDPQQAAEYLLSLNTSVDDDEGAVYDKGVMVIHLPDSFEVSTDVIEAQTGTATNIVTHDEASQESQSKPSGLRRLIAPFAGGVLLGKLLHRNKREAGRHVDPNQPSRRAIMREKFGGVRQRLGETLTDYKTNYNSYYDAHRDSKGWRRAGVHAGAITMPAWGTMHDRRDARRYRWTQEEAYAAVPLEERDRYIQKRERNRYAKIGLGMFVVGAVYPWIADPGRDGGPGFFGLYHKENDHGMDNLGWPLDRGDTHGGNGWGYDYNPDNRSPVLNDDPTIAHWDKSNDSILPDVVPASFPFFGGDGDGMSPPSWWPDWLGGHDATRVWDPGSTGLGPDGQPLAGPVVPPVEGPVVPPIDTPDLPPPAESDWNPDAASRMVRNGDGVDVLVHDWGHDEVGYENFDGAMTSRVTDAVQHQFGQDWLQFADGSDATYIMPDGRVGLRGPGEIKITDDNIRRFLYQLIHEEAGVS